MTKRLLTLGTAIVFAAGSSPASAGDAAGMRGTIYTRASANAVRATAAEARGITPNLPIQRGGNVPMFLRRLGARYVGPAVVPRMTIDVATPLRNEAGLKAYASAASSPQSLYYRHFLTPAQIGNAFGTPIAQYAAAARYFGNFGLRVNVWSSRSMISVTGTSLQLEKALNTKFGQFALRTANGKTYAFVGPTSDVALPGAIGVAGFKHLFSLPTEHTNFLISAPAQPIASGFASGRVNGFTTNQLARAYDYSGAYKAGFTGKGVNLGIIGTGPISLEDFPNYRKIFNVPGTSTVSIVPAMIGTDTTPPPVTGPCPGTGAGGVSPVGLPISDPTQGSSTSPTAGCNPEDEEAQLDTEQTAGLAIDANVKFYLAYNGTGCLAAPNPVGAGCIGPGSASQGLGLADDELQQAIQDNGADILSLSYGGCELFDNQLMSLNQSVPPGSADATGLDPTEFAELAAEGVAVFVSSGDSGSAACQRLAASGPNMEIANASYPSSDPNVVAVGGTTTPIGSNGLLTGPITTWGSQTKSGGAEGAGQSQDFLLPPYQKPIANLCKDPLGMRATGQYRCQPDVVLDADPFTGAAVVFNSGKGQGGAMESPIGGTSQAAPDMAAMWALVLDACRQTASCNLNYSKNVSDPVSGGGTVGYPPTNAAPGYRLGNPNYLLYPLAATAATPGATAASGVAGGSPQNYHSVFYDIVYGDDAVPSFAAQTAGGAGGKDPYTAGTDPGAVFAGAGYDEATGLGAPFARALIRYVVGV